MFWCHSNLNWIMFWHHSNLNSCTFWHYSIQKSITFWYHCINLDFSTFWHHSKPDFKYSFLISKVYVEEHTSYKRFCLKPKAITTYICISICYSALQVNNNKKTVKRTVLNILDLVHVSLMSHLHDAGTFFL